MKIILIGYKKRQGKDTIAKYMNEILPNSIVLHLADEMKSILADTLGITLYDSEYLKNNNPVYRKLLQNFGQRMKKTFGSSVWVEIVTREINKRLYNQKKVEYVIIPDFRYRHEYRAFQDYCKFDCKLITLKVDRNVKYDDNHTSEKDLDNFNFDYIIENNGTLEDLKNKVKDFVEKVK